MKTVNIKYLYFDDKVCRRCRDTEAELKEAIAELDAANKDILIDLETTLSPASEQQVSYCEDCSCLTGKDVSCRSYGANGQLMKEQILTALENYVGN